MNKKLKKSQKNINKKSQKSKNLMIIVVCILLLILIYLFLEKKYEFYDNQEIENQVEISNTIKKNDEDNVIFNEEEVIEEDIKNGEVKMDNLEEVKEEVEENIIGENIEKILTGTLNETTDTLNDEVILYENDELEPNFEIKIGEYCFFAFCLNSDEVEIDDEGNYYTEIEDMDKSLTITKTLSKDKDVYSIQHQEAMTGKTEIYSKIGNNYVQLKIESGCGGTSYIQTVYDNKGKKIDGNIIIDGIPGTFQIGNIEYNLSLKISKNDSFSSLVAKNDNKYIKEKQFTKSDDIGLYLEDLAINEEKVIYKNYILNFQGYSNIKFLYKSDIEKPDRIVWLGTDEDYLNNNIKYDNNYYDLAVTNKIISYYQDGAIQLFNTKGDKITSVNQSDLPVFKMVKLNDDGNYMVYLADQEKFEFNFVAELCKPAVYVYNDLEIKNSLTVNSEKGNYFTKVLPEFNTENTWDFSSVNGKISVGGENYDYLYYAIMVRNYEHNTDGWVIKGLEVKEFFEDKLSKINFNDEEKQDFLEYWVPKYEENKYYFISFKYNEDIEKYVQLDFKNKPTNSFRVLLDSYLIENFREEEYEKFMYKNIGEGGDKYLIQTFDRGNSNYEVFEWGGVLQTKDEFIVY